MLGEIWGSPGRVIFLLVGVATLFGTQLALVDGVDRSIADIVYTHLIGAHKRELSWWYLPVVVIWIVVGCFINYVMELRNISELGFPLNAAYMGGCGIAIDVPFTLYMTRRFRPRWACPGLLCTRRLVIASLVYFRLAISCIVWAIRQRFGEA